MTFDDATMELTGLSDDSRDNNVLLNEIQASVTEAANVIEHEIKGNYQRAIFFSAKRSSSTQYVKPDQIAF